MNAPRPDDRTRRRDPQDDPHGEGALEEHFPYAEGASDGVRGDPSDFAFLEDPDHGEDAHGPGDPDDDDDDDFEEEGKASLDYHPELLADLSPYDTIDGFTYDADRAPDPELWEAFSFEARRLLIAAYHRRTGQEFEDPDSRVRHGMFHVVVENQIAVGELPTLLDAMARFDAAGLSRHDALHAVGAVLLQFIAQIHEDPEGPGAAAYEAALTRLDPEDWRRAVSPDAPSS